MDTKRITKTRLCTREGREFSRFSEQHKHNSKRRPLHDPTQHAPNSNRTGLPQITLFHLVVVIEVGVCFDIFDFCDVNGRYLVKTLSEVVGKGVIHRASMGSTCLEI